MRTTKDAPQEYSNPLFEGDASQTPSQPRIFRNGKDLILLNGASLSSNLCIKTGKPVKTSLSINLHNPMLPETWFRSEKITIGLSAKALETYRIHQTLVFSIIGLGFLMTVIGFASGIITSLIGIALCAGGFACKLLIPIWCPAQTHNTIAIRGCGEDYLKHFEPVSKDSLPLK